MPDQGRVAVADSFRRILLQPNSVTISADDVDDQLTLVAGNFIEFVVNESNDSLQINAASTISASFEGGNVQFVTNFTNSEAATSTTTGAVRVTGGLGVGGAIYASSIQATPIGSSTRASGAFTSLGATGTATLEGTVNINGVDVSTTITPSGIGTVTINPATAGTINNMSIGATTRAAGNFTTLDANSTSTLSGAVNATGSNVNLTFSPTGTGTVSIQPAGGLTVNPTTTGTINNTSIGASTRSTGAFTTLTANNLTTITDNTQSSSTSTGALVVTGGVGIGGNLYVNGITDFTNDLAVNGGDITSSAVTFNLINSNVTTVNFAGAGTAITIGSTSGYSDIRNELRLTKNTAASSTSTGTLIVTGGVGISGNVHAGGTGNFVGITSSGTVSLNPANANVTVSPTGTGTVTINPATAGTINNMSVGATTRSTGAFTTLGANDTVTFTGSVSSNTGTNNQSYTTTGAGVITITSGTVGSMDNIAVGTSTQAAGSFTTLAASGNVTFNGNNVTTSLQPTGTGTVTVNPATTGTINNMSVGATTRSTGAFTTLGANGAVNLDTGTNNQSYTTTGAGVITINSATKGTINNLSIGETTATTGRFTTIESTATTGTAPFIVASTTMVSNLQSQTASKLHTARSISLSGVVSGSANFDGSGNITITTTGGATEVALGSGTTGQYASTIGISGSGLSITTPNAEDGTAYTITSSATSNNTANAIVYRDASGNFSAGTISAAIDASTISASSTVTLNPANANLSLAPTGTGTVTVNPATAGTINNMSIGASTRAAGNFTTLESNGQTNFTANIAGTNRTSGTLVVTGGVGVSGTVRSLALSSNSASITGIVSAQVGIFSNNMSVGSGFTIYTGQVTQFNTDTVTDIDLYFYLAASQIWTQFLRITVVGLYINDQFAPTTYSRINKSMVSGIWYNGTNFQLDGPVIEHQVYNTDSTNFPAGSTPTAGKVQLVIGSGTVLLRLTNRTSASTNSVTYWNYKIEAMVY